MDYKNQFEHVLDGKRSKPLSYHLGHWYAYATDWIELEPGVPKNMEVIQGEYQGGLTAIMIAVEVEGEDYPKAPLPQDNPVLPIFKTAALTADQIDAIYEFMWEGHLNVTNGPIFSDYDAGGTDSALEKTDSPLPTEPTFPAVEQSALRLWTLDHERTVKAEYVVLMGTEVVLKDLHGKVVKVPLSAFSKEDLALIELFNPPTLKLDFKKDLSTFPVLYNDAYTQSDFMAQEFTARAVITQQNMKEYNHPLRAEMYVILDEYDGDNFILMDRQIETSVALTPENGKVFELKGEKKRIRRFLSYNGDIRGEKYKGHMILVYDERGEIIAQNVTHDWLLDIVEKLRVLPVGRHFNKQGERVHPPRPRFTDAFWSHPP
jgi:hypothetical protein